MDSRLVVHFRKHCLPYYILLLSSPSLSAHPSGLALHFWSVSTLLVVFLQQYVALIITVYLWPHLMNNNTLFYCYCSASSLWSVSFLVLSIHGGFCFLRNSKNKSVCVHAWFLCCSVMDWSTPAWVKWVYMLYALVDIHIMQMDAS